MPTNIKTREDIKAWARETVARKGEKYTPLGKADQFAIAEYIVELVDTTEASGSKPATPADTKVAADEKGESSLSAISQSDEPKEASAANAEEPSAESIGTAFIGDSCPAAPASPQKMMRGELFRSQGLSVQAAYDKFLEWSRAHPKEGMVMDFFTGVKSTNAAFAYWLMEHIVVVG